MVPLVWLSFEGPGRLAWDQDIIDWVCPDPMFGNVEGYVVELGGAVVVIPARYNVEHVQKINHFLSQLKWCVIILTSDEESTFPWHQLHHPNMRLWVQTPHPDRHANSALRYLPLGWPTQDTQIWRQINTPRRKLSWYFHGQVNHQRRDDMLEHMAQISEGQGLPSPGFTQGIPRTDYLLAMTRAIVAPAPSGPACPDSFRTWEALECGAVPIVDQGPKADEAGRAKTNYPYGFWNMLFDFAPPFPVVDEWSQAPGMAEVIIAEYPVYNNVVFAWWQRQKRALRLRLLDDIRELGGLVSVSNDITVLVPTSPVRSNPDAAHLFATIASIRTRLPDAEIFIMFDGVRPEQENLRFTYEKYINRVLWLCNHHWTNVVPFRYDQHLHQAEMTRRTLQSVTTPYVLFVEHDTPLEGEIDFDYCVDVLKDDYLDLIRFYHETVIQPEHEHLMGGNVTPELIQTVQWSQRPHLARRDYYDRIINTYFPSGSRTMIEDRMHGVVQDEGWENHRLAIYAPKEGSIKRSGHLDARGNEPKFEMTW